MAKRVASEISLEHVADALGEDLYRYEKVESGDRNPLMESPEFLVKVADVFGLALKDLRETLVAYLTRGKRVGGPRFARGAQGLFQKDEISIAADDLLKKSQPDQINSTIIEAVDRKLLEVKAFIEKHRAPQSAT